MTGKGVRLDGVRKRFGDVVAVAGIDLRVEPGELLVLLGPSGCGKTTTLRAIAGLEPVTEGTIRIGDRDATGTLPQDRDVSMAFQNYALYPHKTVEGNLRFPLAKTDLAPAERDEKVAFVAELLEIGDILDREPSSLSGGQRQRVALGRTIVREPGVFLLDEPLSSLDAELRVATRTELRDLQQRLGTTTVYVTHDQEEAMSVADRIAVMRDGRIEQIGAPRELYVDPATEFVAGFLGDPGMNFLSARTRDGRLVADAGEPIPLGRPEPDDAGAGGPSGVPPVETVGVRPEDVQVGPDGDAADARDARDAGTDGRTPSDRHTAPVRLPIDRVDPLGHAHEVTLGGDGPRIVALTDAPPGGPGDRAAVRLDAAAVHLFAADGRRIRAALVPAASAPAPDRERPPSAAGTRTGTGTRAGSGTGAGDGAAGRSGTAGSEPPRAGGRDGPGVTDE